MFPPKFKAGKVRSPLILHQLKTVLQLPHIREYDGGEDHG